MKGTRSRIFPGILILVDLKFFLLNFKRFLFLTTTSSIFTTMMILHSFLWLSYKVLHISFNILPNREVLENIFVYLFDLSTFSFFLNKKINTNSTCWKILMKHVNIVSLALSDLCDFLLCRLLFSIMHAYLNLPQLISL